MRNCRLLDLLDLDLSSDYVRSQIICYLNRLVDIGVAGFRVDAVKHMWPHDLQYIYDNIKDLSIDAGFASHTRPFIFNEASFCTAILISRITYHLFQSNSLNWNLFFSQSQFITYQVCLFMVITSLILFTSSLSIVFSVIITATSTEALFYNITVLHRSKSVPRPSSPKFCQNFSDF